MGQRIITNPWANAGAVTDPGVSKKNAGWIAEIPTHQNFNWWMLQADEGAQYAQQSGIEEWDALIIFREFGLTMGSDGIVYQSQVASNLGNNPISDAVNWSPYIPNPSAIAGNGDGLRITRDSTVLMTTEPGSRRDQAGASDLILTASQQKQINATWVNGAGGGLPDSLSIAADTWYRRFIAGTPSGGVGLFWDTSATAANFFTDTNAIAAGFTDSSLYRRYGWTRTNGSSQIDEHFNSELDPSVYIWDDQPEVVSTSTIGNASRTALDLSEGAPPGVFAKCGMFGDWSSVDHEILITTADQSDLAASSSRYTLRVHDSPHKSSVIGEWETDASSQIFARRDDASTLTSFTASVIGWVDLGIN